MPWKECDSMSLREEFASLAMSESANISFLCRRFGISRKTGYKWLHRYREQGCDGFCGIVPGVPVTRPLERRRGWKKRF